LYLPALVPSRIQAMAEPVQAMHEMPDPEAPYGVFPPSLEEPDKTEQDLLGDGNVMKVLVSPGIQTWKKPKMGGEVRLSLKATAEDGSKIEERLKFDYILGTKALGFMGPVMDKALQSMCTGEKNTLTCKKDSVFDGMRGTVKMELCLHEIYTITDVSLLKDGTVMKKTLTVGQGFDKCSEDGCTIDIKVESMKDAAGEMLPGFSGPAEFSFVTGQGEVCDALEGAVAEMKKLERAQLTCTVAAKACEPRLGVKEVKAETVILTIEMGNFKKPEDIWELSDEDRVQLAAERKAVGAKLFAAKRFELALQKYKKVLSTIPNLDRFSDELKAKASDIKKAAELNKAMCFLKVGDWQGALESCNLILEDDQHNVKALFRRARARYELADLLSAMADVERVLELDSGNGEATTLQQHIRRAQKAVDKKSAGTYSKMCNGFGSLGSEDRSTAAGPVWELKAESS